MNVTLACIPIGKRSHRIAPMSAKRQTLTPPRKQQIPGSMSRNLLCECVPQPTGTRQAAARKKTICHAKKAPLGIWTHPYHFRAKRLANPKLSLSLPRKESKCFRHLLHPRIHCDGLKSVEVASLLLNSSKTGRRNLVLRVQQKPLPFSPSVSSRASAARVAAPPPRNLLRTVELEHAELSRQPTMMSVVQRTSAA